MRARQPTQEALARMQRVVGAVDAAAGAPAEDSQLARDADAVLRGQGARRFACRRVALRILVRADAARARAVLPLTEAGEAGSPGEGEGSPGGGGAAAKLRIARALRHAPY
jgi:hypothetical protein